MRVAVWVGEFPSLSETFILNEITGLLDRGHEVEIHAARRGDAATLHPDVVRYGLQSRTFYPPRRSRSPLSRSLGCLPLLAGTLARGPRVFLRALGVLRRSDRALEAFYAAVPLLSRSAPDVVHAHFGTVGLRALELKRVGALRGKLVTTFHGFDLTKVIEGGGPDHYRRLFEEGDLFLPISERFKARLIDLGCDEKRIRVHHMGIDPSRFAFAPRSLRAGEVPKLVTVARLVEKKGVEYALRAVGALAAAGRRLEYVVLGDGPLREPLEKLAAELGAQGVVRFLGPQPQERVIEELRGAHLFLGPSVTSSDGDQEGIPVVLMEAMSAGMPILATRHSGIPELVEDGVSGVLVPERDPEALAHALGELLEHPEAWPRMGAAGRRFVETRFEIGALNDRLVEHFRTLLAGEAPS